MLRRDVSPVSDLTAAPAPALAAAVATAATTPTRSAAALTSPTTPTPSPQASSAKLMQRELQPLLGLLFS